MCALLATAVGVVGFADSVVRRRTLVEYYVLFYVCALLAFPGSRQQRYMVPLIPFPGGSTFLIGDSSGCCGECP